MSDPNAAYHEMQARAQSLSLAIGAGRKGEKAAITIARAREYYAFVFPMEMLKQNNVISIVQTEPAA